MYGNRVKETSSTTGTGDITLAGAATGFQSFDTVFSTDNPFHYFILHDSDNSWEQGVGHLSDSTTLVRNAFIDSSTGLTVSFASGGLTIIASPSAGSLFDNPTYAFKNDAGRGVQLIRDECLGFSNFADEVQVADRIYGAAYRVRVGLEVNQAQCEVTAAVASTNVKMALYRIDQAGVARYRVASCRTNTFDTASTGLRTASLDEGTIWIGPGEYLITSVCNGAPTLKAKSASETFEGTFAGCAVASVVSQRNLFASGHTFSTAMPEPLGVTWDNSSANECPTFTFTKV